MAVAEKLHRTNEMRKMAWHEKMSLMSLKDNNIITSRIKLRVDVSLKPYQ